MKAYKKAFLTAAALAMATALSACGRDGADGASSAAHDYTYVSLNGNEYAGTYTGSWAGGQPDGEGSFSGEGVNGSLSIVGNWSGGQPNGECRNILKTDAYVKTYSGNFFYGEAKGSGNYKTEDLEGNLVLTYDGEFRDGKYDGNGEWSRYYTAGEAAEKGFDRIVYKGQFSDGARNGEGELTVYYTPEYAAQHRYDHRVYKGQFVDGALVGDTEIAHYYTSEYAEANGIDRETLTGQYKDGWLVEPYRYTFYNGSKVVEEGRFRDGKYVSDGEKALNDSIYDLGRELAGDGILGDLYDILAPAVYDRDAE